MIYAPILRVFIVIFISSAFFAVQGQEDPPQYTQWIDYLYNISAKQEHYVITTFKLPEVIANPSIIPWVYDNDPNHPYVLISWCGGGYSCPYYVTSFGKTQEEWKKVKNTDNFEVFSDHTPTWRQPFKGGDIRLYMVDGTIRITYVMQVGKFQCFYWAQLYYSHALDALYILHPGNKANIEEEAGQRSQKNWSPFVYDFSNNHQLTDKNNPNGIRRNGSENLFIYSVNPHRIVVGNESMNDGQVKMHTVARSEVVLSKSETVTETKTVTSEDKLTTTTVTTTVTKEIPFTDLTTDQVTAELWKYGEPRGGTPCVLIHTKYGPRYLTFFHSQAKLGLPYILSYYMGAYLFNSEPPFEITHITPDAIIPKPLYDEANGWAFKAIDYIVFPVGLLVKEDTLYVTLGRNDNSGWTLILNQTLFVDSLVPVRTKILENKFFKHLSYSAVHTDADSGSGSSGDRKAAKRRNDRRLRGA